MALFRSTPQRYPPRSPSAPTTRWHGTTIATGLVADGDRKSTRLNSSHGYISYAVFCLKKKKKTHKIPVSQGRSRPSSTQRLWTASTSEGGGRIHLYAPTPRTLGHQLSCSDTLPEHYHA